MNEVTSTLNSDSIYLQVEAEQKQAKATQLKVLDSGSDDADSKESTGELKAPLPEIACSFTEILWNRKIGRGAANFMMFSLWFIIGLIQAYQMAVVMKLQEKKASMTQQAIFSVSTYPYTFKLIFAPFMDSNYFFSVGKCKTWLTASMFLLSGALYYFSTESDSIRPEGMNKLTVVWFCIHSIIVITQIASEMWIVKLYDTEDDKSKGSMVIGMGMTIGAFFGLNVFIPLNHVDWLNENWFTQH